MNDALERGGYRELTQENLEGLRSEGLEWLRKIRGREICGDLDDECDEGEVEMAFSEMDLEPSPDWSDFSHRVIRMRVANAYALKEKILADVAEWASAKFGKAVSPGVVEAAWDVAKSAV